MANQGSCSQHVLDLSQSGHILSLGSGVHDWWSACESITGKCPEARGYGCVCSMACSDQPTVDELSTAAATGNLPQVKRILATGNINVNERNHYGRTALQVMRACRADVAEVLLQAGADPNIMDFSQHANNHTRMTPAHDVARQGYLDTLRCLLRFGADVTLTDAAGNTPAHLAAKHGHYHIVRYLSHAVDLHQYHNHASKTPLQYTRSAKKKHLRGWLRNIRTSPSSLCSLAVESVRHAMGTCRLGQHRLLPLPPRLQEIVCLQVTPSGRTRLSSSSLKENAAATTSSSTSRGASLKRTANRFSPLALGPGGSD